LPVVNGKFKETLRMKHGIIAALIISLVTGCAYNMTGAFERPDGTAFNTAEQPRMASASHWQLVSENEAKLLKQKIVGKPIFVEKNPSSNFTRTYHNLLTSSLVQQGANIVTENRPDNTKITYEVQVVHHEGGKQISRLYGDFPHFLAGAVYYVFSEAVRIVEVPPAVFADQMVKNLSSTTEVVLTTRAIQDARLLYSASSVYYIENANQWDYQTPLPPAPQISPADGMWNYQFKKQNKIISW
jgi:hypothetical protein